MYTVVLQARLGKVRWGIQRNIRRTQETDFTLAALNTKMLREKQREREKEKETDIDIEGEIDRETEIDRSREGERYREKQTDRHNTYRHTYRGQ